jgi:hypothetical protein
LALAVSACGGRVAATANGAAVPLDGDAAAFVGPTESCPLGGPRRVAGALITNLPQTCSVLRTKSSRSTSGLFLFVAVEGTALPRRGTYRVDEAAHGCEAKDDVGAELVVSDGDPATRHRAIAGTIALTTVEAARIAGTFDVVLEGGGRARGSFAAPVCDVDWTLYGRPRPREGLR